MQSCEQLRTRVACPVFFMPYHPGSKQPTAADVIRHLEHMINVAGENHVAIGTDGTISPALFDQKYQDSVRRHHSSPQASRHRRAGETEDGYLNSPNPILNTPRRLETLGQMLMDKATAPRASRRSSVAT